MIYRVRHETALTYASKAVGARLNLRLKPVDWPGQALIRHHLEITPEPVERTDSAGPYVVNVTSVGFTGSLSAVKVLSTTDIEITPAPPPVSSLTVGAIRDIALAFNDLSATAPAPYLYRSRIAVPDPDIADWAAGMLPADRQVLDAAKAISGEIHRTFTYDPSVTDSRTPPARAFADRSGVCQDFAHIMIVALRAHGIPAAYVSGYLRTEPPPGMQRLVGADAMHAWAAVWCGPDLGWIGIDPTNDCLARESHIVVAMGRDYADVAPIDGVFTGSALQAMTYMVDVAETG